MRGVSERTIQRSWEKGRLYLHHAIGADAPRRPTPMPRISPDRWRVLSPYLDQALEISADERGGWLAVDLGQGLVARQPTSSAILVEHQTVHDSGFLERAGARSADRRAAVARGTGASDPTGWSRRIGQGGSGSVWLAERC